MLHYDIFRRPSSLTPARQRLIASDLNLLVFWWAITFDHPAYFEWKQFTMANLEKIYRSYCRTRFPPLGEKEVDLFEKSKRLKLPPTYRDYLIRYNGGGFRGLAVHFPNKKSDALTYMHGINSTFSGAELGEDLDLFDENFPASILPIGGTGFGALIILIVGNGENRGNVLVQLAHQQTFEFLAKSVDKLFTALTVIEQWLVCGATD